MSKLYLAGPMSGIAQFNYPLFLKAAEELREKGWEVLCPAEMDDDHVREAAMSCEEGSFAEFDAKLAELGHEKETWGDFLSRDVKLVADDVDGVVVLPGWEVSRGARLELYVALTVRKPIYAYVAGGGAVTMSRSYVMDIIREQTVLPNEEKEKRYA